MTRAEEFELALAQREDRQDREARHAHLNFLASQTRRGTRAHHRARLDTLFHAIGTPPAASFPKDAR